MLTGLPPFVSVVGLFVNPEPEQVRAVLEQVPLDLLQFHGDEASEFCQQFGRPWIKAIRAESPQRILERLQSRFRGARGLLVDAYDPHLYGGTGKTFDWALIPAERPLPLVLAGGLNSANVAAAVRRVRPWAVDVSGGVRAGQGHQGPQPYSRFHK